MSESTNLPKKHANYLREDYKPNDSGWNTETRNTAHRNYTQCIDKSEVEMGPKPNHLMGAVAWIEKYYEKLEEGYQSCGNLPITVYPDPRPEVDEGDKWDGMIMEGSDVRLKHNIKRVGASPSGIPTYTFQYLADKTGQVYHGTMAQDLLREHPNAVGTVNGFYAVAYDLIDVDFYPVPTNIKE